MASCSKRPLMAQILPFRRWQPQLNRKRSYQKANLRSAAQKNPSLRWKQLQQDHKARKVTHPWKKWARFARSQSLRKKGKRTSSHLWKSLAALRQRQRRLRVAPRRRGPSRSRLWRRVVRMIAANFWTAGWGLALHQRVRRKKAKTRNKLVQVLRNTWLTWQRSLSRSSLLATIHLDLFTSRRGKAWYLVGSAPWVRLELQIY